MALKQTLITGYGTGLTDKQKQAVNFRLDPGIIDSQDASGEAGDDMEGPVFGGADASNATALSLKTTTSLCISTGLGGHVSLADGVLGQVKRIIHQTRIAKDLVITPDNFAAGTNITSNLQKRSVTLMYDGDNWQVIAGEITGTAEFVIG